MLKEISSEVSKRSKDIFYQYLELVKKHTWNKKHNKFAWYRTMEVNFKDRRRAKFVSYFFMLPSDNWVFCFALDNRWVWRMHRLHWRPAVARNRSLVYFCYFLKNRIFCYCVGQSLYWMDMHRVLSPFFLFCINRLKHVLNQ